MLGTILDPAADKALVTTLTVTLAMSGMLPRAYSVSVSPASPDVVAVPLAVVIIGLVWAFGPRKEDIIPEKYIPCTFR